MSRIEDVALAAGVSTATVSRALRGLPKVSAETRQRVLDAAAEARYIASPTASSLASGKTGVVAVVVPYVTRWYFAHLIAGASQMLREHGYHVLLVDVGDEGPGREMLLDSRLFFKRVDAALVLSLRMHPQEREMLGRLGFPVVSVGVPSAGWSCVRIDDVGAIRLATEHLIGLGHERIAFVGGKPLPATDFTTPGDRETGFRAAMADAGLPVRDWQVANAAWTPAGGLEAGLSLLRRRQRPTAVVVASDEMAIGVLSAAREPGHRRAR
ncbi:LacI family transcriptional regulator [Angustibacter aerolatus]|uniref:LacI family transcriptional regulator n=1 Tax=Angustibacter aerolatus TaxID=1162965 RepID=A0ABQ6JBH2_9ACTN|nr:LacI family DNA-binding transcriptional regulator [Angustibacter aerolatus]GMA85508.1 LacI family transcriptional regulator [Angustibacter aerolatus]